MEKNTEMSPTIISSTLDGTMVLLKTNPKGRMRIERAKKEFGSSEN